MTVPSESLPVATTWDTLQQSRNEAAVQVLASGLKSAVPELRHASLQAISARKEAAAGIAVVVNWSHYDERDLEFLRKRKHRLTSACAQVLATGSLSDKQCALAAIDELDLPELLDELLQLVVGPRAPIRKRATEVLLDLCQRWGLEARVGKARAARRQMIELMYRQLLLYHEHQSSIVLDAWLKLVHWEDAAQRALISDARLDAYWAIMDRLRQSQDPAVLQLLAGYLGRSTTPQGICQIITERPEPELLIAMANLADEDSMPGILRHLARLPPLACIENLKVAIAEAPQKIQHRLWVIVAASSEDVTLVLRSATQLAAAEDQESQQVAREVLRHCRTNDLQSLVPALQNEHASASGDEELGALLREVASWVDGPWPALQSAAKKFLCHFTVANLLAQVRVWPAQMCSAMAEIVKIVEPDAADTLARQLRSPAPKRRIDALQVTKLLGVTHQVSQVLMQLLDDPRLTVRVSVIELLSATRHEAFEALLPELQNDASTDIQDAARRALRRIERQGKAAKNQAAPNVLATLGHSLE